MLYLMDSVRVAPGDAAEYLAAFEAQYLPPARARGEELVACWHTPQGIGEDVTITAIFRLRDFAHWNELRRAQVLDPAMPAWIALRRRLVRGGQRHFYHPAACSPSV